MRHDVKLAADPRGTVVKCSCGWEYVASKSSTSHWFEGLTARCAHILAAAIFEVPR